MSYVTYEQRGFVGVITIDKPKALNALNSEVLGSGTTVVKQVPEKGKPIPKEGKVYLYTDDSVTGQTTKVPDFTGKSVTQAKQAAAQAREFGHSLEREVSYLAVHSVLHLLGYDHLDEGPMKRQMREREEAILNGLGIRREE